MTPFQAKQPFSMPQAKWHLVKQSTMWHYEMTSFQTTQPFPMPSEGLSSKATCDTVKSFHTKQPFPFTQSNLLHAKWNLVKQNNVSKHQMTSFRAKLCHTLWSELLSSNTMSFHPQWHLVQQWNLSQCQVTFCEAKHYVTLWNDIFSNKTTFSNAKSHLVKQNNLLNAKSHLVKQSNLLHAKWSLVKQHTVIHCEVTSFHTKQRFLMPSDILSSNAFFLNAKWHLFTQSTYVSMQHALLSSKAAFFYPTWRLVKQNTLLSSYMMFCQANQCVVHQAKQCVAYESVTNQSIVLPIKTVFKTCFMCGILYALRHSEDSFAIDTTCLQCHGMYCQ